MKQLKTILLLVLPVALAVLAAVPAGAQSRRRANLYRIPVQQATAEEPLAGQGESGAQPEDLLQPLRAVQLQLHPATDTIPPEYYSAAQLEPRVPRSLQQPRGIAEFTFQWAAPGLAHEPLYFEDVPLERYGHTHCALLQPAVSGAKFFAAAATLPYRIGVDPPFELDYTLGYARPGSWAPHVREQLPLSLAGAVLQGGAVTGAVFMFP